MDMQNVSNLQISEGAVRTIHDKDNRLLWGSVGYDVSFDGNATQTTYSGKNKLNYLDAVPATNQTTTTFIDNGFRSVTTSTGYATKIILSVKASTTYTLSWTVKKVSGTMAPFVRVYEGTRPSTQIIGFQSATDGSYNGSFTTASGVTQVNIWFYNGTPMQGTTDWTFIQLEESATKTDYEPFVGDIPAPNPDYPQDVNVVAGAQTVTIGDGVNAEDFAISLGPIELCKIGDYQDYIYKSGDDWWLHKAIGASSPNVNAGQLKDYTNVDYIQLNKPTDYAGCGNFAYHPMLCTHAIVDQQPVGGWDSANGVGKAWVGAVRTSIWIGFENGTTLAAMKAALDGVKFYYALAAPTDTKITDATLVGQLEAIHKWLTRYGYNATVSGDLPIVLQRDSLQ